MTHLLKSAVWTGALLLASSGVWATSFVATTDALGGSLVDSFDASSSSFDDKRIAAAHDEAAGFVASSGALRGPRLEAAFELLRTRQSGAMATDLELAEAILAR